MNEILLAALRDTVHPPILIVTDWLPTTGADLEDGKTFPDLTRAGMGPMAVTQWEIVERVTGGHSAIAQSIVFHNHLAEGQPVNVEAICLRLYDQGAYLNFLFERFVPARVVPGKSPLYLGTIVVTSFEKDGVSYNTLSVVGSIPRRRR